MSENVRPYCGVVLVDDAGASSESLPRLVDVMVDSCEKDSRLHDIQEERCDACFFLVRQVVS